MLFIGHKLFERLHFDHLSYLCLIVWLVIDSKFKIILSHIWKELSFTPPSIVNKLSKADSFPFIRILFYFLKIF